jgi:hypothetical protein
VKNRMGDIRKIRRATALALIKMSKKTPAKMSPLDIFLSIGIVLLILGFMYGGLYHTYYNYGRPERLVNSRYGTYHVSAIPPGDPKYKEGAKIGTIGAIAGVVLTGTALLTKLAAKKIQPTEEEK